MSRDIVPALLIALAVVGCGGGESSTAPTPKPPDNPNQPLVQYSVAWTPSPSTITLTAPSEDLVVNFLWVSYTPPGYGGAQLLTDLPNGTTLHAGVPVDARVTTIAGTSTSYVWTSGDKHVIRVTVHRPGQSLTFTIYLLQG